MTNNIPLSARQVTYLTLVMFLPLLVAFAALAWAPPKPGQTPSDTQTAAWVVGTISLLLLGIVIAVVKRHTVELTSDTLVVRHSLYTLRLSRNAIVSASVRQVASVDELGLSARTNGVAAFGYLSGWFKGIRGDAVFCAISQQPVQLITFEGKTPCRSLAISASPDVARRIEQWCGASR